MSLVPVCASLVLAACLGTSLSCGRAQTVVGITVYPARKPLELDIPVPETRAKRSNSGAGAIYSSPGDQGLKDKLRGPRNAHGGGQLHWLLP